VKKLVAALCATMFLLAGLSLGAQANPLVLPVGSEKPTVDGAVGASEYPVAAEVGKMTLRLSRDAETVFAAFSAETTGWVAVGFGSPRMDAALMFIGFVSADGKTQLKIQKGRGHTHADVESDSLTSFAMKEAGGVTTLELALKASSVIGKGATELPVIFAMGGADSFASLHRARASQQVKLQ
jgi:hypothetical protein